jgi:type II secretory pathway pseudopilin PulG
MSSMKSSRQTGAMNLLIIPLVLLVVAVLGIGAFAASSYSQAQDYKTNVDQKVAAAVEVSNQKISEQKEADFAEKEKYPYDTYVGPEAAGSVTIKYPKTWSAYVVEPRTSSSTPVDGFFNPNFVPDTGDNNNSFALRVSVVTTRYDSLMKTYATAQKSGKVTITPYQSPNVPSVVGSRVDGEIESKKQGVKVLLPFRDKTLMIWTESTDYKADFENIILKNFTLTP